MPDMMPYRRLALAVLEAAVRDAHAGCPQALAFLANGSAAFWCRLLGLSPGTVLRLVVDQRSSVRFAHAREVLASQQDPRSFPPHSQ